MPKWKMIVFEKDATPQEIYEALMTGLELHEPLPESEAAGDQPVTRTGARRTAGKGSRGRAIDGGGQ